MILEHTEKEKERFPLEGGRSFFAGRSGLLFGHPVPIPEDQGNAPQGGDTHQGENDPGNNGILTSADPGYQVKTENAHQPPVDAANDDQGQRDPV